MDSLIMSFQGQSNTEATDEVVIKIIQFDVKIGSSVTVAVEEEFRSALLKLLLLDVILPPVPHDYSWTLMATTKSDAKNVEGSLILL